VYRADSFLPSTLLDIVDKLIMGSILTGICDVNVSFITSTEVGEIELVPYTFFDVFLLVVGGAVEPDW
jgi:hypothetical protein